MDIKEFPRFRRPEISTTVISGSMRRVLVSVIIAALGSKNPTISRAGPSAASEFPVGEIEQLDHVLNTLARAVETDSGLEL